MSSKKLYSPLKVNTITTTNHIFITPLTRLHNIKPNNIPTPLITKYYHQHTNTNLIINKTTQISTQTKKYTNTPNIHNPKQITT